MELAEIENNIPSKDLPQECELMQLSASREDIKVMQLGRGLRLIIRDSSDILVPHNARQRMMENLHLIQIV